MTRNPGTIDPLTKEWWEIRRAEILEARKVRRDASRTAAARWWGWGVAGMMWVLHQTVLVVVG
jgi:hypothetical protein